MDLVLVIVAVDDPDATAGFLARLTSWPVTDAVAGVYTELRGPTVRVGVYSRKHYPANFGASEGDVAAGRFSASELYISVSDAAASVAQAVALGGTVLSPPAPRPWGDTVAYVESPGGLVVALAEG